MEEVFHWNKKQKYFMGSEIMKKVVIGGGQGFWGDSPDAAVHMVKKAELNYLACDYLAELTLSIMQRQKNKNPQAGYARDFVSLYGKIAGDCREKGIHVISNAGGMNIPGCVDALENVAKTQNLSGLKIGYVLGDDLKDSLPELMSDGLEFKNSDTGAGLAEVSEKIVNVNVYYGADPIIDCLKQEADVIVTGRAADSALFLAPLKYEFGWKDDDWNQLAKGIMVGHLLECGGQGSGGNFEYDWRNVPQLDELGFPIAEVTPQSLHITKAPDCGGLITEQSCKEQLLYEVHNPAEYITPDITVDISRVTLNQEGENRVCVDNIAGHARPDNLKLCVGYHAGFMVSTYLCYAWPDAYEKAQYAAEIIMKKMKRKNLKADQIQIDYLGLNALHLGTANMDPDLVKNLNEVVLRIAIRTKEKSEAEKIVPEIAPLQLNGPPGSCFFGGRAKVSEVIGLWPTFIPRECVKLTSHILEVK